MSGVRDEKSNSLMPMRQDKRLGIVSSYANHLGVEAGKLMTVLKNSCFKSREPFTDEEVFAGLWLAHRYSLDPFAREFYLFRGQGGQVSGITGIDGWIKVVNSQPNYDGCEFEWQFTQDGLPFACTCKIYDKSRSRPFEVTEFYDECVIPTSPNWRKMPKRLLRHRAFIQCARLAFGLSGLLVRDEAEEIARTMNVTEVQMEPIAPQVQQRNRLIQGGSRAGKSQALKREPQPLKAPDVPDWHPDVQVEEEPPLTTRFGDPPKTRSAAEELEEHWESIAESIPADSQKVETFDDYEAAKPEPPKEEIPEDDDAVSKSIEKNALEARWYQLRQAIGEEDAKKLQSKLRIKFIPGFLEIDALQELTRQAEALAAKKEL